ncbi:hypothetical protein L7F22_062299 [Adiantum nelumboides]|nr:hypothetical protein [Adiantum nelumboides]
MTVGTRSGGDALKKQELRAPLLQALDEKSTKLSQFWNGKSEVITNKEDRHGIGDTRWIENLTECPVYCPTKEEFVEGPLHYIQKIAVDASKYGICKIVSPVIASVPAGVVLTKEQSGFRFTTRIQPMRISNWDKDDKIAFPIKGRHYTLTEYEKVANRVFSRKFSTAAGLPPRFIESVFWKELVGGKTRTVEYATDVDGSAFSNSKTDPLGQSKWNLKGISRLPNSTLRLLEETIPGVTEPMLYIGMLFSMFAWHIEDHYLYSINYQHCGAPKTWYGVPGDAAPHFEKVVKEHVYSGDLLNDTGKSVELDLLLGKTTMFAPKLLMDHGVPVFKAVQYPGEYIITFPRAYHAGFSHGFNCGEAVNFAMADWFPFGAEACLRYEFLNRSPLLPHDELLCKEATTIIEGKSQIEHKDSFWNHKACIMMALATLVQFHQQVKLDLERRGAKTITSHAVNVSCGLCKHKCYVGYTHCKCFPEPCCFNHGDLFSSCSCEGDRTICLRDDFANLQLAAQKYEHEQEIRKQAHDTAGHGDGALARGASESFESSLLTIPLSENYNLEISGVFAISNCRQAQIEEQGETDTEVLKIKRRRVASPQSNRFQVDEQEIDKSLVRRLDFGIFSPARCSDGLDRQEHTMSDKKEHTKSSSVVNRDLVSVRHVIDELNIKGSVAEVLRHWQIGAKRQGSVLRIKEVTVTKENLKVLPLKSLSFLKHLVSREEAKVLQRLIRKVKSGHYGLGHRNLVPPSASVAWWSCTSEICHSYEESGSSSEEKGSSCEIRTVGCSQLTTTTESHALPGELHSDNDQKNSAESKIHEGLSSVAGSTVLFARPALTELQDVPDVQVCGVSAKDEAAAEVKVAFKALYPSSVLCDPGLACVEGGHVRKEECSFSEPLGMESEQSIPLTEPGAEIVDGRKSLNLQGIVSSSTAEIENEKWQGMSLADDGRLCDIGEGCSQFDKSLEALEIKTTLPDRPAEVLTLVDLEPSRNSETANAGESSINCSKVEIKSNSLPAPKRGLVIYLNQKIEQPHEKAAKFSHEQKIIENDYDQVDIFEGQAGANAWCLDTNFCSIEEKEESISPLEQLTSMCGEDFLHHHLEHNGAQGRFAKSFEMKAERPSVGGEFSAVGYHHRVSVCSEDGSELTFGKLAHNASKLHLNLEPNSCPMVSQQVVAEKDCNLDSIKLLSYRDNALPTDTGKLQKVQLSCEPLETQTGLRNFSEKSDDTLDAHASSFGNRSHWRETSRYNAVDKPFHYTTQRYGGSQADPYGGQSTDWGCSQQGRYDLSSHHPTGQIFSRNESDKYKRKTRRPCPSLHQEHHPYRRDAYRSTNYPRNFHEKEKMPPGYWKRRPNRHYNGGWQDAKSIHASGGDRQQFKGGLDRHVAECSLNPFKGTGYVEGYDPVKWEISPANYWRFSSTDSHAHSLIANRGV